jgi:hypothetical protein
MRKRGNVSLIVVLAALCTALILCSAWMGGAKEVQPAGGAFDSCAMYRAFRDIGDAWREGRITNRDLVLAKVKAFYEENSGVDPTCSAESLEDLKQEVLEDVYRLSGELLESDKLHLRSLSVDLAEALDRKPVSSVQAQPGTSVAVGTTTFGRIAKALGQGRISLKESVLLRARLLYAPRTVLPKSEFAPRPGEKVAESSWLLLNQDVHRVKDLLNADEKALLRSLNPNLDAIVRSWERAPAALPNYPQLNQTYTATKGTNYCQVHYTTNKGSADAVPNLAYVQQVASTLNAAIAAETKNFHAAYPEGGGLLQVYCLGSANLPNPGVDASWVGVGPASVPGAPPNAFSGYIVVNTNLNSGTLTAVIYHEYFHGIQAAYNVYNDVWLIEGSATWAEAYYGQSAACWKDVADYYTGRSSIFNLPNDVPWDASRPVRSYSYSALVYFFSDKYGGYKFVLAYLENSINQDDAVANLAAVIPAPDTFEEQYKLFLLALYNKDISSIKRYMPNVKLQTTYDSYGQTDNNSGVYLLGAEFYKLKPPAAPVNEAPFIAWLTSTGSVGAPVGVLAWKGSQAPANTTTAPPNPPPTSYLPNAKQEAVYIATDVIYTNSSDVATRPYLATMITPYVKITNATMTPNSPVLSGTPVNINAKYNLLGTLPGQQFGVQVAVYNGKSSATSSPYSLPSGNGQTFPPPVPSFTPSAAGTYDLTLQMSVPQDSWAIDQVTSTSPKLTLVAKSSPTPPQLVPGSASCAPTSNEPCPACCRPDGVCQPCSNDYFIVLSGTGSGDVGSVFTFGDTLSNFSSAGNFPQLLCRVWHQVGNACVRQAGDQSDMGFEISGTPTGDCYTDTITAWGQITDPSSRTTGQVSLPTACCQGGLGGTCP